MRRDIARVAALSLAQVAFITIMIYLMLLVASQPSKTAACFAPHVMEQRPDNETFRPSPSRIAPGINI